MPISQVPSEQFPCHVPGPAVKGEPVLEERKMLELTFLRATAIRNTKPAARLLQKKQGHGAFPWPSKFLLLSGCRQGQRRPPQALQLEEQINIDGLLRSLLKINNHPSGEVREFFHPHSIGAAFQAVKKIRAVLISVGFKRYPRAGATLQNNLGMG
jgi:hypothetical protein